MALVSIIAVGVLVFAMRRFGTKKPAQAPVSAQPQPAPQPASVQPVQTAPNPTLPLTAVPNMPFRLQKSIQTTAAFNAKDELRMLDLEREILGDAIRRLYEAQAEGKITETERDKLAQSYKQKMNTIKDSIAKDEGIIALHELESMQEDLMKLFSERFGDLSQRVEELRGRIDVKPIREIQVKQIPTTPIQMDDAEEEDEEEETSEAPEKKPTSATPAAPKKRKPTEEKPSQKTESEKRIDTIRSEVEKVLDKLGQMEIET
jgi:hypothetical protein